MKCTFKMDLFVTSFSDYLSLMLGKPRIRLNNLKTSPRFPCLGLNPIIDSINLPNISDESSRYLHVGIFVIGVVGGGVGFLDVGVGVGCVVD